jgi:hypothetical protein
MFSEQQFAASSCRLKAFEERPSTGTSPNLVRIKNWELGTGDGAVHHTVPDRTEGEAMTGAIDGYRMNRGSGPLAWIFLVLLTSMAFMFSVLSLLGVGNAVAAEPDGPFPLEPVFSFGPDGTEATNFNKVSSVALDQQSKLVYVLEETESEATLLKFGAGGEPVEFEGSNPDIEGNRLKGLGLSSFEFSFFNKVAVDSASGVIYVIQPESILAFESDGEPAEFTAGPGTGSNEIPGLGVARSVAVDSSGSIYVADSNSNTINVFASTGQPLTSFAVANPRLINVAPDGTVYVIDVGFSTVRRFTPSSFPVSAGTTYSEDSMFAKSTSGSFQLFGLSVDPSNGEVYLLETGNGTRWIMRYDAAGTLIESLGAPGSSTESKAFGGNSGNIAVWGEAQELVEGGIIKLYLGDMGVNKVPRVAGVGRKVVKRPPEITKTFALDVTADSAKLRAWIDPGNLETTYRFEYGLEDCAVAVTPCTSVPLKGASAGEGGDPIEVSQPIFGLQPNTTYHYRVLAENSLGPAIAPDESLTFTTQPLGIGYELIDSRAWEMVSPPDKRGAQLKGAKGGLIRAASDGDGLAYNSLGSIDPDPDGNRAFEYSAILARRGPGGWASRDIALPNQEVIPVGVSAEGEYKLFNPDLSRAVVMPRGATLLSPQASERTAYLRQEGDPATYTPLLSGKEGFANVPPGTEFGGSEDDTHGVVKAIGATPDLSHVALVSQLPVPLVAGFPAPGAVSLYLWSGGQLRPISVLPAGEGGSWDADPALGSNSTSVQNAISTDGSRVFWGRMSVLGTGALYVRDTVAEQTTRLDVPQGGSGADGARPVFQGASADGTVVFFKDTRDLTADASPAGYDLYRCEIPAGSPAAGCAGMTNISAPLEGSGESAEVLGMASGLSEDGTRIYFVARGVLDEASNQYGDSAAADAVAENPNLYLWEEGKGTRFIASLDEEDKGTWGFRGTISGDVEASKLSAAISPGGRYLSFMSQRSLSGQANLDAASGEPAQEVFRYDAEGDSLSCISCNPFGATPEAMVAPAEGSLVNPHGGYDGARVAATLPAGYRNESRISLYRPRATLDNGRVFFNSFDSLVPVDSNGEWDVYQWEPSGAGSCSASSGDGATVRSAGGCVSLLSSGTGEEEAAFLDASESGEDVFFLTPARLSVTDKDRALDVYDARVGGVEAKEQPQPECKGEACRSAAAPPQPPTPGSASFSGPVNPKPGKPKRCPKGKQKKRVKGKVRCVPNKQSKQSKQKGKASKNRGAVR